MDPLTLALLMGGVGLAKSELLDRPQANKQRELAAKTQMYAPWTGLQANKIQESNPFGDALQYGATGASMATSSQNAKSNKELTDAYKESLLKGNDSTSTKYFGGGSYEPWDFNKKIGAY